MNEIFSIKGKVAIISGAGGVLGGSIAKSFIQAGAKVVAIDIRQENLDSRIKELTDLGGEAIGVIGNVLDIESLEKVAETVVEKWGRIDILLNIAGGNIPAATLSADQCFFDMDLDGWNKATNLNMNGTVYPSYVFGKVMAKQGSGSIINISSMAAYSAITRVAGYSAAKAAITNFTQWLASDLAIKFGDGIRVNAIAPGFVKTQMTEKMNINLSSIPLRRVAEPEDIAAAAAFLASETTSARGRPTMFSANLTAICWVTF